MTTNQKLSEIMPIDKPELYKVHCGDRNPQGIEPLSVFANGYWDDWQEPWGEVNRFNRQYIFTMMRCFYERDKATWIFGGVYEVSNRVGLKYDAKITDQWGEHIGRLKLKLIMPGRNRYRKLETIYNDMEFVETLPENFVDKFKTI